MERQKSNISRTTRCADNNASLVVAESFSRSIIDQIEYRLNSELDISQLKTLMLLCLNCFDTKLGDKQEIDPIIGKLLAFLQANKAMVISGKMLAQEIILSESRMQHLFKQELGIPIRRYILWTRLRDVLKQYLDGVSLTQSAHKSGFSDGAHFSRTFKSMFGINPSLLRNKGGRISTFFYD